MKNIKKILGMLLVLVLAVVAVGCGGGNSGDKGFKEPAKIGKSLQEICALDSNENLKKAYRTTVLVESWGNNLSYDDDAASETGCFKATDLNGENRVVVIGSTASTNALTWDKEKGVYIFSNPSNFLTNEKTKGIKIGYELELLVVRDDVKGTTLSAIIVKVTPHEKPVVHPEPEIEVLDLTEIIKKDESLDLKYAYKTTVKVSGFGSTEKEELAPTSIGALKVTDLDGNNKIVVLGSTMTRKALSWDDQTGEYEFNNPKDFLSNEKTYAIQIGDKLDVILVKVSDVNYVAVIIGINHTEETLLTYANYADKNLEVLMRKNASNTRVATLYTDIKDISKVSVKFSLSEKDAAEVITLAEVNPLTNNYYFGCFIKPTNKLEGVFKLTCSITQKDTGVKLFDVETLEVKIYSNYVSLAIDNDEMPVKVVSGSFTEIPTLGYYSFDSATSLKSLIPFDKDHKMRLPLIGMLSNGSEKIDYSKLILTSSDEDILTIGEDGYFYLGGKTGLVEVDVIDKNNLNTSTSIKLNVLSNGINISTYEELMVCSKNIEDKEYVMVLKNNIMLAPELEKMTKDDNYEKYALSCLTTMDPTCDVTYYKNTGKLKDAVIRYAVEISTDLYGNGYAISADNLTQLLNKKFGTRVYRGPIDLVRYNKDYNGAPNNLAVKSQDNIIFAVLKDNINIHNVELKGCNDESIASSNGEYDLTNLDYCGTVLEIVGDNCNVSYSRINNGRTAVRVFGKAHTDTTFNPSDYRITATFSKTLFINAREFLLKIGTNQVMKTTRVTNKTISTTQDAITNVSYYDDASPYLSNGTKNYVIDNNNYKDEKFYNNYILTDITVQNCVFMNAGLFSIGLEAMFGGLVLHGWDFSDNFKFGSELGWGGISGTSYPALLRLKDDVRFYDWKKVSSVNSDTLIEGIKDSNGNLTTVASKIGFNLNFSSLLKEYYDEDISHEKILASYNGETYVNGAIAYYGGGKNYSCVALDEATSTAKEDLHDYTVDVDYFSPSNPKFIYYTAGKEKFRFLLYDATSSLTVEKQEKDIFDTSAYDILKDK